MFSPDDTIVAIATPAGRGSLGVVRISGGDACEVAARILIREASLLPRHATSRTPKLRRKRVYDYLKFLHCLLTDS